MKCFSLFSSSKNDVLCCLQPKYIYMDGVVQELNYKVLGKGLELLSANGGRFEINQRVICR